LTKIQSKNTWVVSMDEVLHGGHGPSHTAMWVLQDIRDPKVLTKFQQSKRKPKQTIASINFLLVCAGKAGDAPELSFTSQRPRAQTIPLTCFGESSAGHTTPDKGDPIRTNPIEKSMLHLGIQNIMAIKHTNVNRESFNALLLQTPCDTSCTGKHLKGKTMRQASGL
jgi:hypothetical protein